MLKRDCKLVDFQRTFREKKKQKRMMEDCIYQNLSARQWAEKTFRLDEEIADIRGQLNIYKPLLLRLVDIRGNIGNLSILRNIRLVLFNVLKILVHFIY